MKQPKKLTRNQKEVLSKNGFNWKDYLAVSQEETSDAFTVIDKKNMNKMLTFQRGKLANGNVVR